MNAIELEVPGVSAQALRDGLLADQTAREELFGGSVTLGGRLLLVAELADAELARTFAERIGGDLRRAETHYGEREFVEGPAPVRVEQRTLVVSGGPEDETVALRDRFDRLEIDLGADGSADFDVERKRFDRVRVGLGDGIDTLAFDGSHADERFERRRRRAAGAADARPGPRADRARRRRRAPPRRGRRRRRAHRRRPVRRPTRSRSTPISAPASTARSSTPRATTTRCPCPT